MTFPSYFIQNYYENEILNVVTKQFFRTESYEMSTSKQYLKIIEKVALNIASEASYVYILRGQKLIKKCQKWSILASF